MEKRGQSRHRCTCPHLHLHIPEALKNHSMQRKWATLHESRHGSWHRAFNEAKFRDKLSEYRMATQTNNEDESMRL